MCLKLASFLVVTMLLMPLVLACLSIVIVVCIQLGGSKVRLLICIMTGVLAVVSVVPRFVGAPFAGPGMSCICGLLARRVEVILLAWLAEGFSVRVTRSLLGQLRVVTVVMVLVRRSLLPSIGTTMVMGGHRLTILDCTGAWAVYSAWVGSLSVRGVVA